MQNALRTGRLSHAYILNGSRGSGKRLLARTFSAAIQCEDPQVREGRIEPCGRCRSCLQIMSGSQPDIRIWPREHAPRYSVRDIRSFRPDVKILPYASPRKIYILEDAQNLNVQAQNALLKTLEEPPAYAVFFLLSDGIDNFLPTVLSRCVVIQVRPVAESLTADYLVRKKEIPADRARLLARFSGGSIGRALLLTEDEVFPDLKEKTLRLLREIPDLDAAALRRAAEDLTASDRTEDVLDLILTWLRDVLLYKNTGTGQGLIFEEEVQYIRVIAKRLTHAGAGRVLEAAEQAARRRSAGVNTALTMELLLLAIRRACAKKP